MQITDIGLARSIWQVKFAAYNPGGLALGPIHRGLIERYRFVNYPAVGPDNFNGKSGAEYGGGEFVFNEKTVTISVKIFNDGITADSATSTQISDAFLEDLSQWLMSSFGLLDPRRFTTTRLYDSQIFFKSDANLMRNSPSLRQFTELLRQYTGNPKEEPWALLFEPDQGATSFSFERRVNVPFSENHYFSKAVLATPTHIELIEQFEKLFS